jgi:hypothetical protein
MNYALWRGPVHIPSSYASENDLRCRPEKTDHQNTIALRCRICDCQAQYLRQSWTEKCLFCGSEDLTVIQPDYVRGLLDVEPREFSRAYYEPKICFDDACALIAEFSGMRQSHWEARGAYFPIWDVLLHVHCVWEGHRFSPKGGLEASWRPASGVDDYQTNEIRLPVTPILAESYIVTITGGTEGTHIVDGPPIVTDAFCTVVPTLSPTEAWRRFHGEAWARKDAEERSKKYCERLKRVKAVIQSKHFSLVYLPVALVRSIRREKDQAYFVNLLNGAFGEIDAGVAVPG